MTAIDVGHRSRSAATAIGADLSDDVPCGYLVTRPDGTVLRVNATVLRWTGHRREDVVGRPVGDLLAPGGRIYLETFMMPVLLLEDRADDVALDVRLAGGGRLPVLVNGTLGRDDAGRPSEIRFALFDASQRLSFERDLVRARQTSEDAGTRLRVLHRAAAALGREVTTADVLGALVAVLADEFAPTEVSVWLPDPARTALRLAASGPAGRPDDGGRQVPLGAGSPVAEAFGGDGGVRVAAGGTGTLLAVPLVAEDQVLGVYRVHLPTADAPSAEDQELHRTLGEQAGAALSRAALHEELDHRASHDPLTGTLNRAALVRRLQQVLDEAAVQGTPVTVLFVDLDGFKAVNDLHGHQAGDALLIEVSRRLRSVLRERDLLGRLGGDEFVAVCPESSAADSPGIAERLRQALDAPRTEGRGSAVSASVGVTIHDPLTASGRPTADDLLRDADAAMYQAKAAGKGRSVLFDADLRERLTRRAAVEGHVRAALAGDGVVLDFQPVFDLATDAVTGVEALCRIETGDGERLMPDEFIGIAEDAGLLVALGERILRTACAQAAAWTADGLPPVVLAVNVAAVQAARPTFADEVLAVLSRTGLPPHLLLLELTESTLLAATGPTLDGLRRLRDQGIGIALDDFGTSYASLRYVQQFPLTRLKIDRSFVAPLPGGSAERAIVRAVSGLAADLGMQCTAEGVETAGQRDFLAGLGVHGQGYALARPMPAREFHTFLDRRPRG